MKNVKPTYEELQKQVYLLKKENEDLHQLSAEITKKQQDFVNLVEKSPDITTQKRVKKELEFAYNNLEQRMIQRMTELKVSNEKLQNEIVEREKAEIAMRESEKKYQFLFNNANDAILIAQKGFIKFFNRRTSELIDYSEEELSKIPYISLIHPDDRSLVDERKQKRKMGEQVSNTYSLRIKKRKGAYIWVQLSSKTIKWEGQSATINFLRDITEQKKLEAELHQAQKLEAIGTLAGGIAHDFNNILYPIMGYAELLQSSISGDDFAKENITNILDATHRAKDLVQQILTFCRKTPQKKDSVKIEAIIEESYKLLRASIPSTITFDIDVMKDCGHIQGDATQIQRVIMNLCTNSYQAMKPANQGTIEVKLREVAIKAENSKVLTPGRYLKLTVGDNGPGIEQEHLERIFDPYFTTKFQGKGTGLGLSVVHGIVKGHHGDIEVQSKPGNGTWFHIYLPCIKATCMESPKERTTASIPTGSEHILFVDDEESITEMNQVMLSRLGYKVTAVSSSMEALELFQANPYEYDLLITDMTMPQLTGDRLAGEIIKIRKDLPVILCSGFSEYVEENRSNMVGIREYITKPILMSELARKIRKVLDETKTDRRKFNRYNVQNGDFVISSPEFSKQCHIIDISKGGIAFKYYADSQNPARIDQIKHVMIENWEEQLVINDIPCSMVSDSSLLNRAQNEIRRCGIQFGNMSSHQLHQLDQLFRCRGVYPNMAPSITMADPCSLKARN